MCKVTRSFVAGIGKSRAGLPLLRNDMKWLHAIKLPPNDTGQVENMMALMELLWMQSSAGQDLAVACTLHEVMGGYVFIT